jgi:hypothetical protein
MYLHTVKQLTRFSLEEGLECAVINPQDPLPYVSVHSTCYTVIKSILQRRGMQVDTKAGPTGRYTESLA